MSAISANPLDAAAETRLLLAKAAALSEKNGSSAGDLFTKLLRELQRLRDENAAFAVSLESEKAKTASLERQIESIKASAAKKEETLQAKIEAMTENFTAQKEKLLSDLTTGKAEITSLNQQVAALRAALLKSQSELQTAQRQLSEAEQQLKEATATAANATEAAALAAAAPVVTGPTPIETVASIAGVPLLAPAPAPAPLSVVSTGAGAMPAPPTTTAAAAPAAVVASGSAAADRIRIATLEKRLLASEARVEEANLRLDLLQAQLRAAEERTHTVTREKDEALAKAQELLIASEKARDLAVTNDQLRSQLLSMLQQQESINIYLSLMLDADPRNASAAASVGATVPSLAGGSGAVKAASGEEVSALLLEGSNTLTGSSVAVDSYLEAMTAAQKSAAAAVLHDYNTTAAAIRATAAGEATAAPLINAAVQAKQQAAEAKAASASAAASGTTTTTKEDEDNAAVMLAKAPLVGFTKAFGGIKGMFAGEEEEEEESSKDNKAKDKKGSAPAAAFDLAAQDAITKAEAFSSPNSSANALVAAAVKENPWLSTIQQKDLYVMRQPSTTVALSSAAGSASANNADPTSNTASSSNTGEPSFIPISMLSHRLYTHLWRSGMFALDNRAGKPEETDRIVRIIAERNTASDSGLCFAFSELPLAIRKELDKIPGLIRALETSGCYRASLLNHPRSSNMVDDGSGDEGGDDDDDEGNLREWQRQEEEAKGPFCLILDEAAWDRVVSTSLPAQHRGTLLLLLCDRMRVDTSDLVIPLSGYMDPVSLLDNDDAIAIQEHLFTALAARCWNATTSAEAEDAVKIAYAKQRDHIHRDLSTQTTTTTTTTTETASAAAADEASPKAVVVIGGGRPLPKPASGLDKGFFTREQLFARVPAAWSLLSSYSSFTGRRYGLVSSGTGEDGAATATVAAQAPSQISLTFWHAFFAQRSKLDPVPQVLHLFVSLRRILKVPTVVMSAAPTLTPLLEQGLGDIAKAITSENMHDENANEDDEEGSNSSLSINDIDAKGVLDAAHLPSLSLRKGFSATVRTRLEGVTDPDLVAAMSAASIARAANETPLLSTMADFIDGSSGTGSGGGGCTIM